MPSAAVRSTLRPSVLKRDFAGISRAAEYGGIKNNKKYRDYHQLPKQHLSTTLLVDIAFAASCATVIGRLRTGAKSTFIKLDTISQRQCADVSEGRRIWRN